MKLTLDGIKDRSVWEEKGYALPDFDRAKVEKETKEAPFWIHFGAGNIFRAFQCNVVQNLLNDGTLTKGLTVAEGYDYELIEKMNHPHDDLSILMTLKSDGSVDKTVVGSVMESLALDSKDQASFSRLKEIFQNPSLQMATFTITEKGYSLTDAKGDVLSSIQTDYATGPERPESYLGKVCSLIYDRFLANELPIALVSMDNCSHNGDKLKAAVLAFAENWVAQNKADAAFLSYVQNATKVSYPWTMIDKITPRPDAAVEEILKKDGVEGTDYVVTSKNTYIAPFVNAEECEYLVIEDDFPNGRPALEKGGLIFTTRETVEKVERKKVCTFLNPLHTALAVYGCLLGYDLISKEMKDDTLHKMVERIGYVEGLPVVTDPGILDPKEFIDTVINIRIPNPFMPDTPQRIATDTSQKLSIRFGETIKEYQKDPARNVSDLKLIPLVHAGWLRYLMGQDDNLEAFTPSPDPMLSTLEAQLAPLHEKIKKSWKQNGQASLSREEMEEVLHPILSNETIFGVDLYDAGLADTVLSFYNELIAGKGAIRATLEKYVKEND